MVKTRRKPHRMTADQQEFLRRGYLEKRAPELTEAFNAEFGTDLPPAIIKGALSRHGFKCGRPTGNAKGSFRLLTTEQATVFAELYQQMSVPKVTEELNARFDLNLTPGQLRRFATTQKIGCDRTGRFQKGDRSWNHGTKGLMKPNSGSFQPGHTRTATHPIGHERICSKDGYVWIKVDEPNPYTGAPTRYRFKHHVVWEQANGKIPKGHVLFFRDGDKTNCDLSNLVLITRGELAILNRHTTLDKDSPAELRDVAVSISRLRITTSARKKALESTE